VGLLCSGLAEIRLYTAPGDWNSLRGLDNLAVSYAQTALVRVIPGRGESIKPGISRFPGAQLRP